MLHLDFIVWMFGFPLVSGVEQYLIAMRKRINGNKQFDEDGGVYAFACFAHLVAYVWIAKLLW